MSAALALTKGMCMSASILDPQEKPRLIFIHVNDVDEKLTERKLLQARYTTKTTPYIQVPMPKTGREDMTAFVSQADGHSECVIDVRSWGKDAGDGLEFIRVEKCLMTLLSSINEIIGIRKVIVLTCALAPPCTRYLCDEVAYLYRKSNQGIEFIAVETPQTK